MLYRRAYWIGQPDPTGRKVVGIAFDSETRLTSLKGWGLRPGAPAVELKEKDTVETSPFNATLYEDTREKLLALPATVPGTVVGYEYEQRRRSALWEDRWEFQQTVPVQRARFVLRLPRGWHYLAHWLHQTEIAAQAEGENTWAWQMVNVPALATEPGRAEEHALAGALGVMLLRPQAESGGADQASWRRLGAWYAHLTADRVRVDAELQQIVRDRTAGVSNTVEKIRALAGFVQKEIRYVAIEIGTGGYQPHAATDVLRNRYGDCKDKATLLRALLQEAGISSFYVLVHSTRGVVSPEFPSMLNFNHVILAIQVLSEILPPEWHSVEPTAAYGKLLYFDPTHPFVPLGLLPESLQGSEGLLVSEGGGELRLLPVVASGCNKLFRNVQLTLTSSGAGQGTVTEFRMGAQASAMRAQLLHASVAERRKLFEALATRFAPSGVLQAAQVENLDELERPLLLHYRFEASGFAQRAGDLLLVRPGLGDPTVVEWSETKEGVSRRYSVELPYTSLESEAVDITLPESYALEELPTPLDLQAPWGEYHSQGAITGSTLHYVRRFEKKVLSIPVVQWNEWQKFQAQVRAEQGSPMVLKAVR